MCHSAPNGAAKRRRVYDQDARKERWQDEKKKISQRFEDDPNWWSQKTLPQIRFRAKKSGITFNITADDIPLPTDMICPVLGILMELGVDKTDHGNSPSVDRIDNSKGYEPGNVRVISNRANSIKRDSTLQEILAVAKYMLREQDK